MPAPSATSASPDFYVFLENCATLFTATFFEDGVLFISKRLFTWSHTPIPLQHPLLYVSKQTHAETAALPFHQHMRIDDVNDIIALSKSLSLTQRGAITSIYLIIFESFDPRMELQAFERQNKRISDVSPGTVGVQLHVVDHLYDPYWPDSGYNETCEDIYHAVIKWLKGGKDGRITVSWQRSSNFRS